MRIVTADDHKIMAQVLRQIITSSGHEIVGHAMDGREAIDLCRTFKPDIVTLDMIMPPMNGDQAAEVIHAEGLAGRMIFATSNPQQPVKDLAQRLNAILVAKPYNPAKLKAAIEVIERESIGRRAASDGDIGQLGSQ